YVSLSLELNFAFDWWQEHLRQPAPNLAAFLRERPSCRVLVLGGYYDLATPLAATLHAIRHSGAPPSRVETLTLTAGHSLPDDDALRTAGTALRSLLARV